MQTIVPLGVFFVLSAAGCSDSSHALTAPDDEVRPSVDPASKHRQPDSPCEAPDSTRYRVSFSRWAGSVSEYGSAVERGSTSCNRIAISI
jgi:hypothetical protein